MRLGVIGVGAMGEAIVASVVAAGVALPEDVAVADPLGERVASLASRLGVRPAPTNSEAAKGATVLVLAVKPQDFEKAASTLGTLDSATTLVSIMAGVPLARLAAVLGHQRLVRAMPNTPAQVGEGMTVWTATPAVDAAGREAAVRVLGALGHEAYVADERYLDMATAVNGSGPAYVFLFIEALVDAAVAIGLPRDLATELALQTVGGSAAYARETGRHPAELRALVTSPGGTTAAALRALEAGGFRAAVSEAVAAAYNRARELGEEKPRQ